MNNPLVSISCITYNHAPYIRQCLDGFLMQECDFEYEILIHDDASTDGTSDIIREYQEKYPEIIKPIMQTENQYSKGIRGMMARFNFPRAKGKYIALCEGDDYWTHPLKLQKQVDFLEENPEYSIIGHNLYVIEDENCEEIIANNWVYTQCMLFKKALLGEDYKEASVNIFNGDTFLYHYLCLHGKPITLDFFGAVYRKTGLGIYTSIKSQEKILLNAKKTYLKLLKLHKKKYKYSKENLPLIEKKLIKIFEKLLKYYAKQRMFFSFLLNMIQLLIFCRYKGFKKILKLARL